jgi:hypothetical protein
MKKMQMSTQQQQPQRALIASTAGRAHRRPTLLLLPRQAWQQQRCLQQTPSVPHPGHMVPQAPLGPCC